MFDINLEKRMKDIITSLGCFALGGYVVYEASSYPTRGGVEMHPGHYPGMLAYIMIALGVVILAKYLWKGTKKSEPSDTDGLRAGLLVVALVLYVMFMETLGYALATFIFVTIGVYLFRGSLKTSASTGIISAAALFVLFYYIFMAPLPTGFLFN